MYAPCRSGKMGVVVSAPGRQYFELTGVPRVSYVCCAPQKGNAHLLGVVA